MHHSYQSVLEWQKLLLMTTDGQYDHLLKVCILIESMHSVHRQSRGSEKQELLVVMFYTMHTVRGAQVLLVGDSGVGKSALLVRFTLDQFHAQNQPTIGEACCLLIQ